MVQTPPDAKANAADMEREAEPGRTFGLAKQKGLCTENLIGVDDVMESPKLAE